MAANPTYDFSGQVALVTGAGSGMGLATAQAFAQAGAAVVMADGAIVNCSSLGALVGIPGRAAYHASKHGVLGLTSSAALEYAHRGIRINAVCPGTIASPMVTDMIDKGELDLAEAIANQPINRLGEPDEIAAAVLWLCNPEPASSSASPCPLTAATPPAEPYSRKGNRRSAAYHDRKSAVVNECRREATTHD
jgi:NAD(P)-dependent dehydrogenase (short-subunit alcohol dehydrogenase family)